MLLVQERAEALIACEEANNQGLMASKESDCECKVAIELLSAALTHVRTVISIMGFTNG